MVKLIVRKIKVEIDFKDTAIQKINNRRILILRKVFTECFILPFYFLFLK